MCVKRGQGKRGVLGFEPSLSVAILYIMVFPSHGALYMNAGAFQLLSVLTTSVDFVDLIDLWGRQYAP